MAFGINNYALSGRLTRDPELRKTPSGTSVCDIGICYNERVKNAAGEWEDKPHFFTAVAWAGIAEAVARDLKKGDQVTLAGSLIYDSWESPEGEKRSQVKLRVEDVVYESPREA